MKKFVLLAAVASAAAFASPAAAQSATGTVNITGHVDAKCIVVTGTGTSGTFGTNVDLGDLAAADGTLATDLASRFTSTGGTALSAKVVCTGAAPTISVNADTLTASAATATTGYDNSIDFTARATLVTVGQNNGPFENSSAAAAGTAVAVGSRLANQATNVTISAFGFQTNSPTDLLAADPTYSGKITVVIAPI